MKIKRAFLIKPGRFELQEVDITLQPDELLVKVETCGLCNWELNHWKGLIGQCPLSLGHEWAGIVEETGKSVDKFKPGDRITALPNDLSGFSEYTTASSSNCFKLDRGVNIKYALGEPLKCIVTVLRSVAPEAGDNGLILGCGPMGLWCIQALSGNLLSSLIAVDIDDKKLEFAKKFGATHTINPFKVNAIEEIGKITKGLMADFVIEGTGNVSLLNDAMSYLKVSGRGRLILMSSHESSSRDVDFREAIKKSIEIKVPHPGYSMNQFEDMRRAVSYINKGIFKMDDLISHKFSLGEIQKAFETLENKPKDYIKGIVIP